VGDLNELRDKFTQSTCLEQLLPPRIFVSKLNALFSQGGANISKRVHIQAMNALFLLMMLDMNALFSFQETTLSNNYYIQACNQQEVYVGLIQRLSRSHGLKKIETGPPQTLMEIDTSTN
jgi:hypothetical protein